MSTPLILAEYTPISSALAYVGMTIILLAFVLETRGRVDSRGHAYLGLMVVGSALLAIRAAHVREWAFFVLEAAWCVAAAWALYRPSGESPAGRGSR